MDRNKIIARIRKLYAMSQASDSSPNEAEIALRRCQSLMLKFGVRESELHTSEFGKSSIGRKFRNVPSYVTLMSSAVALLHDCLCVDAGEIEFRGFSIDAEVARLSYDYLTESMERSLRIRKREGEIPPGRSASFDYRVGYAIAVLKRCRNIHAERLLAEEKQRQSASQKNSTGASLVVLKRELVEENCCADVQGEKKRTVKYRAGTAHSAGESDGSRVSLDTQLAESGKSILLETTK